jgi:hypothetical protein
MEREVKNKKVKNREVNLRGCLDKLTKNLINKGFNKG